MKINCKNGDILIFINGVTGHIGTWSKDNMRNMKPGDIVVIVDKRSGFLDTEFRDRCTTILLNESLFEIFSDSIDDEYFEKLT